jgi:DNA mismatch repair protein MSH6
MGGKSTLLRQTCLCVILAQIGCFVPARRCVLSPVDRVFTRVGASDRIMENQSTFFVELSETATILNYATARSLVSREARWYCRRPRPDAASASVQVILDELGRGTSTFDGTAIAHAVVDKLCQVGARTLFATHYHSLVREVGVEQGVQLGHMACIAEEAEQQPEDAHAQGEEHTVTFLFKLQPGSSDRSYGLNVARLARVPDRVIRRANAMSLLFEEAFFTSQAVGLLHEVGAAAAARDAPRVRALARRAGTMVAA